MGALEAAGRAGGFRDSSAPSSLGLASLLWSWSWAGVGARSLAASAPAAPAVNSVLVPRSQSSIFEGSRAPPSPPPGSVSLQVICWRMWTGGPRKPSLFLSVEAWVLPQYRMVPAVPEAARLWNTGLPRGHRWPRHSRSRSSASSSAPPPAHIRAFRSAVQTSRRPAPVPGPQSVPRSRVPEVLPHSEQGQGFLQSLCACAPPEPRAPPHLLPNCREVLEEPTEEELMEKLKHHPHLRLCR